LYLIPTEEKKAKKFERGLNSRIQVMMSYFNIRDFSQLVDKASIYEESLKENAAEYADQKRRTHGTSTSIEGVGLAKRMAVGSFPPRGRKDVPLVTSSSITEESDVEAVQEV
jgi:type II secretory pathway component PulK